MGARLSFLSWCINLKKTIFTQAAMSLSITQVSNIGPWPSCILFLDIKRVFVPEYWCHLLQYIDKHITKYGLLKVFRKGTVLRNYAEAQTRAGHYMLKHTCILTKEIPASSLRSLLYFLFQNNLGLHWRNLHCQDPSQWNRSHGQFY